jgi:hypothetical protein
VIKRRTEKFLPQIVFRYYSYTEKGLIKYTDKLKGSIISKGTANLLFPLHLRDTVLSYYSNSRIKSEAIYENNRLVSNKNWLPNGNAYFDNIFFFVDNIPEYSMGQVYFRAHILSGLQESEIDLSQISDKVVIGWIVTETGETTGFHVVSGAFSELNNLLIKLIQEMPGHWIPATLDAKAVRYYMNIPFNFIDRTEGFESLEFSSGFVVWD